MENSPSNELMEDLYHQFNYGTGLNKRELFHRFQNIVHAEKCNSIRSERSRLREAVEKMKRDRTEVEYNEALDDVLQLLTEEKQ